MKAVFGYIRVSTVRQGTQGSSLIEQQSAIERYAAKHELHITEWFEELETAAKRGRPVFNRMLKLLGRQRATGVIIHKIDRSARNLKDWADLAELTDRGVEIHFAHESLDMQSRGGRLAADIQAVVAADYVRNLRDEVKKGIYGRYKQGLYPHPAPIGYLDQGGGKPKIPDPVRGPLVRRAFDLYATGNFNLETLRRELTALGLRTRGGGQLSRSSLAHLLSNEFYTGIIAIDRTKETYVGVHEPLIAPALFAAVACVLRGRKVHVGLKHDHPFRKLIRCASCLRFIIGEQHKGWLYYRCQTTSCPTTSLRQEGIEEQMRVGAASITLPPEAMEMLVGEFERLGKQQNHSRVELAGAAQLALGQIDEKLARLTDIYLEGTIDRDHYLKQKSRLIGDRAKMAETLRERQSERRPYEEKVEKFLELQRRLQKAKKAISQAELINTVQTASLNLLMDRKNLLIDWKMSFREAQKLSSVQAGGPQPVTPRTFEGEMGMNRQQMRRHFRAIYNAIISEADG
jgi:site-specific DNA recombinase